MRGYTFFFISPFLFLYPFYLLSKTISWIISWWEPWYLVLTKWNGNKRNLREQRHFCLILPCGPYFLQTLLYFWATANNNLPIIQVKKAPLYHFTPDWPPIKLHYYCHFLLENILVGLIHGELPETSCNSSRWILLLNVANHLPIILQRLHSLLIIHIRYILSKFLAILYLSIMISKLFCKNQRK